MKKTIMILVLFSLFITGFSQNYKYSSKPLSIMGFTKDATIKQVEIQLDKWNIKWNFRSWDNTVEIEDVTWAGLDFEKIWFTFNPYGRIKWISCYSPKGNDTDIEKAFSNIVKEMPYRSSKISPIGSITYIYNGKDDSEFATYVISKNAYLPSISFSFYFNGSIYENGFTP